jgi:branched-chain amino acid transport system substrate-binding protein
MKRLAVLALVVFAGLMPVFLGLALPSSAVATPAEAWFVTQLTSNNQGDLHALVCGDRVAWSQHDGHNDEVYTWTPQTGIVRLTSNSVDDYISGVSDDRVVWVRAASGEDELWTWTPADGAKRVTTATDIYTVASSGDRIAWSEWPKIKTWTPGGGIVEVPLVGSDGGMPEVSGDRIAWVGAIDRGFDAFTWTPEGGSIRVTTDGRVGESVSVSGDRIAWVCMGEPYRLATWTPSGGIVEIPSNPLHESWAVVSGDRIVWHAIDGADRDIFTWTPDGGTVQITENAYEEDRHVVSGDRVAWTGKDATGYGVFAWTPADGTVKLTSNGRNELWPEISGDRLVWGGYDGSDYQVFTAVVVPVVAGFSDVPITHAYGAAIEAMAEAGVISGFPDGTFRPDQPVIRQQFAKMIVKTLGLEISGNEPCPFRDVGRNMDPADPHYPRQYVAVCAQEGITLGKTATTFAPYANITRAQLLTMVVRGAALFGVLDDPSPAYYQGTSEGTHRFRSWNDPNHAPSVQMAEFNGLLEGILPDDSSGLAWDPYGKASRGEVAQILWRLRQKIDSSSLGREIRIGVVTPLTFYLAMFGVTDWYCVDRWQEYCGDGVVLGDGKRHRVRFIVRDSQSAADMAVYVTGELVRNDKVDLVLVASTADTVNWVSDTCERLGVPCISTDAPWQNYFFGRGGDAAVGFKWTYHYCWGLEDVVAAYLDLWGRVPTNRVVGAMWPNDADGNVFRMQFTPALEDAGYKLIDPGAFQPEREDYTSLIAQFKNAGVEIVTGVMTPLDFNNFWIQGKQQGFSPKIVTMSQALRFPQTPEAIGDLGVGLTTEVAWSPGFPFQSSLTGEKAEHVAADFEVRTGRQWSQTLIHYALGEIAIDVLKRAQDPKDKDSILEALRTTKLDTIAGPVDFASPVAEGTLHPVPNVYKSPVAGGQWVKGTMRPYDLRIVGNAAAPMVPLQGDMQLLP